MKSYFLPFFGWLAYIFSGFIFLRIVIDFFFEIHFWSIGNGFYSVDLSINQIIIGVRALIMLTILIRITFSLIKDSRRSPLFPPLLKFSKRALGIAFLFLLVGTGRFLINVTSYTGTRSMAAHIREHGDAKGVLYEAEYRDFVRKTPIVIGASLNKKDLGERLKVIDNGFSTEQSTLIFLHRKEGMVFQIDAENKEIIHKMSYVKFLRKTNKIDRELLQILSQDLSRGR